LAIKVLAVHHDKAPSHTSFLTRDFVTKNNMTVVSNHPIRWLGPCDLSVSPIEDKTERP
jgi:hypothetical protein